MYVETNLDFINEGEVFPTMGMKIRNAKYRLNESRRNGSYADNKYLVIRTSNGEEKRLAWKIIPMNKFKLYENKMINLIFNRDPLISTGTPHKDTMINNLIDKTHWVRGIKRAVGNAETYGDGPIKTYTNGVSAFSPVNAFKVVNQNDVDEVMCYVLVDYIRDKDGLIKCVRFETHLKGFIYERVYEYDGVMLGRFIEYNYDGRVIKEEGNWYETGLDEFMVQWLSIGDDVYGISPFEDFAPLLHEAERRQTLQIKVLDAHTEPILAVGVGMLKENEVTGKVEAFDILGNILEVPNGQLVPEYITWDGKLDSNEKMLDTLFSEIYELTELGKTFMTGEYTGNISEESINSLVKSAIDRGNRHVWDFYYEIKKSLYVLCRLNGIDVTLEELNIVFQVGQTDSEKTLADVINSRVEKGTLSVQTALQRYDGLTEQQALDELDRIRKERRTLSE